MILCSRWHLEVVKAMGTDGLQKSALPDLTVSRIKQSISGNLPMHRGNIIDIQHAVKAQQKIQTDKT